MRKPELHRYDPATDQWAGSSGALASNKETGQASAYASGVRSATRQAGLSEPR